MNKKLILAVVIFLPFLASAVGQADLSAFKYYKVITPQISVPTVVEISFNQEYFSMPVFSVYDTNFNSFEPSLLVLDRVETQSFISTIPNTYNSSRIYDGDYGTFVEFPLEGYSGQARINFNFEKPVSASSLRFALDEFVSLPQKISVSAEVNGKNVVVLAGVVPNQNGVVFPKTTSASWEVVFDYVQPLRISEMQFNESPGGQLVTRNLRFLAQPGHTYQVYFDADRNVEAPYKESGDLSTNAGVARVSSSSPVANPEYRPGDSDSDQIPDLADNCSSVYNPLQEDGDRNRRGDACEDYDRDGILDGVDNCPQVPNVAQTDTDADKAGDVCDNLDNRVTERMPWLPWLGIGIAGVVLIVLFVLALKHKPEENI